MQPTWCRGGAANADVYRAMTHAINLYESQKEAINKREMPLRNKSLDDLENEVRVETSKVASHVYRALQKFSRDAYDEEKKNKIEALKNKLDPMKADKRVLDEVIEKAHELIPPQ